MVVFLRRVRRARSTWDRRVAWQDLVDDATAHLNAERERDNVEQENVVASSLPSEQIGLHSRTEGHDLVRVDVAEGLLFEQLGDVPAHGWNACRAAHENDAAKLFGFYAHVPHCTAACDAR